MYQIAFAGRAPPGPTEEFTVLPDLLGLVGLLLWEGNGGKRYKGGEGRGKGLVESPLYGSYTPVCILANIQTPMTHRDVQ